MRGWHPLGGLENVLNHRAFFHQILNTLILINIEVRHFLVYLELFVLL